MVLTSGLATLFSTLLAFSSCIFADTTEATSRRARHHQSRQSVNYNSNGMVNMAYYGNWGLYRGFTPVSIPDSHLTHILYSFANVKPNGTVTLSDEYADLERPFAWDFYDKPGTYVRGNINQLYRVKQNNRNVRVLLSIGGYAFTQKGAFDGINDADWREKFITSAITSVSDFALDGLDIDFEYPTSANIESFYLLLKGLRTGLDDLAASTGQSILPFELTIAVPAGAANYAAFEPQVTKIDAVVNFWNLMAYDYCGSGSPTACDQANLYGAAVNTDAAVKWYISKGATRNKLVMGMPLYGRGFSKTDGRNQAFTGVPPGDTEAGVYEYKTIAAYANSIKYQDLTTSVASWTYNSSSRVFISYDNVDVIKKKAKYVGDEGLGGAMFWEVQGDAQGALSLIKAASDVLGRKKVECNHLYFPLSKYNNIRADQDETVASCGEAIPVRSSTTTTSSRRSTTTSSKKATSTKKTTSTKKPAATPTPKFVSCSSTASTKGACKNVPVWSKGKWYDKGKSVQCNGRVYKNSWGVSAKSGSTTRNAPTVGEKSGAWKQTATC